MARLALGLITCVLIVTLVPAAIADDAGKREDSILADFSPVGAAKTAFFLSKGSGLGVMGFLFNLVKILWNHVKSVNDDCDLDIFPRFTCWLLAKAGILLYQSFVLLAVFILSVLHTCFALILVAVIIGIFVAFSCLPAIGMGAALAYINWRYDYDAASALFATRTDLMHHNIIYLLKWFGLEMVVFIPFRALTDLFTDGRGKYYVGASFFFGYPIELAIQMLPAHLLGIHWRTFLKPAAFGWGFRVISAVLANCADQNPDEEGYRFCPRLLGWVGQFCGSLAGGMVLFKRPKHARTLVTVAAAFLFYLTGMPAPHHLYLTNRA